MDHLTRSEGDEYYCSRCGLRWGKDDPELTDAECVPLVDVPLMKLPELMPERSPQEWMNRYGAALQKIRRACRKEQMSRETLREIHIIADEALDD